MKINNLVTINNIFLAPMAGVADASFRAIAALFGAGVVYSEMISAKALCYGDKKTHKLLKNDTQHPTLYAVQLFGRDPAIMARAAAILNNADYDYIDFIDINCGCPAPKITRNGEGSALLTEPLLIGKIVEAVVSAQQRPVTIKIRSGWDDTSINAIDVAKIAEQSGASAIMVHPRTAAAQYRGDANRKIIQDVVNIVNIPIIGNGDVKTPADAAHMVAQTNCAAVAIGRAALGRPWIFEDILNNCTRPREYQEIVNVALEHFTKLVEHKGEHIGILEARKHACWYIRGTLNAAKIRQDLIRANTLEDMRRILTQG